MAAYYFPPLAGSGVYRSIKFAKYLLDYQWTPVVVSTDRPPKTWNFADDGVVGEIPKDVPVYRISDPLNSKGDNVSLSVDYAQRVLDFWSYLGRSSRGKKDIRKTVAEQPGAQRHDSISMRYALLGL